MANTAAAGVFNAFAIAGAGYLFKMIDGGGYSKEMHRHNIAMERLTKARESWSEARLRELDRLGELHREREDAGKDLTDTNRSFLAVRTKFEESKPILSNFYTPSKKMDEYLTAVKFLATFPVLYGVSTFLL